MNNDEPTIKDILDVIGEFSSNIDKRFEQIDQRFEQIDQRFEQIDKRFEQIDKRFEQIDKRFEQIDQRFEQIDQRFDLFDSRLNRVESLMVTKDYLDEKLSDLKGDLVVLTRKQDNKFNRLVEILGEKKVLDEENTKELFSMPPFAKV